MNHDDTICAVSTPAGEGGIGIIRVSGHDALALTTALFRPRGNKHLEDAATHTLHYGYIIDPSTDEHVDEALVSVMRAPATYTREDIVEINCHGGMAPLWRTIALLIGQGARQAQPGEFTKRAFLNGRIDLAQAEAVMEIIRAKTELALKAANEQLIGGLSKEVTSLRDRLLSLIAAVEAGIDFPEEDIETATGRPLLDEVSLMRNDVDMLMHSFRYGKIFRDGYATAIVGRPNVGKSSLLNALLRQDRAIVTEIPGTTRDLLEEYLNIDGVPLRILDTAGIRHSHDRVEQEGVRRSIAAIESADIVILVLDGSIPLDDEDRRVLEKISGKPTVVVVNKSDLKRSLGNIDHPGPQVFLSCRTGAGLDDLRRAISDMVKQGMAGSREHSWAINQRHKTILEQTKEGLEQALVSIKSGMSPEFVALDLRTALDSLGLIIGATYTDDILEKIFSEFCIGK